MARTVPSEAMDPEARVALAVDAEGKVHGVLSWLPAYRAGGGVEGWTLDVMRRLDGGFSKTMEFLIASSALEFKEQGSSYVSLGGAPLARWDRGVFNTQPPSSAAPQPRYSRGLRVGLYLSAIALSTLQPSGGTM